MPRSKLADQAVAIRQTEKSKQCDKLMRLIYGAQKEKRLSDEALGKLIGLKHSAAGQWLNRPSKEWPLYRLLALGEALDIPIEEFRDCIRY